MGYDLEWVDLPDRAAAARARYLACTDLDFACVHTPPCAMEYLSRAEPYQFH